MNNLQIKKISQIGSYYIYPVILSIASFSFPSSDLFGKFGSIAFLLLAGNLFLRPATVLIRLWPIQTLFTLRREIGIASFWSYFFHAAGMVYVYGLNPFNLLRDTTSYIFFGAMAGLGMYLLAITSNDFSVRFMRKHWKRLHRLAYLVFFLSLYHSSLAEGEPAKLYLFGGAFIIAKILEFRKIPFIW